MMFIKILKIFFVIFCIAGVTYIALPNYSFPAPPPDSLQSQEPADLETPLRRGYFTNYTRAEVLSWYKSQLEIPGVFGIRLPMLLLNYPPEYAQTLIRDQTGSTFLQEYVHLFRDGLFINGDETPESSIKPKFFVGGKPWELKIIIRYIPTSIWVRETIFIATAFLISVIYRAFSDTLRRKNE